MAVFRSNMYMDNYGNSMYMDNYGNSYDSEGRYMDSVEYENAKLNSMMAMQHAQMMQNYGSVRNQYAQLPPATPAGPDTRLLLLEDTP